MWVCACACNGARPLYLEPNMFLGCVISLVVLGILVLLVLLAVLWKSFQIAFDCFANVSDDLFASFTLADGA